MLKQVVELGDFIHHTTLDDIPGDAMHMARRCLLDTLGIWLAGSRTEPALIAREHAARRMGSSEDACTLAFDGRPVSRAGQAFAGAIAIDSIDGHDGHQLCKGHAGAALLPALFAELGDRGQADLDTLLAHLVTGYEVAIRAGLSLHASVPDYHSSGAWNAIGCAALGARLRRLSAGQTRHALGIAEYYGPRAQMMRCIDHPTMVKDSTGWGAHVGVTAADLAQDGFTGAPAITCEADEVAGFWSDLGTAWRILETNFKAYPVCRWAQPAIEALLALMRDERLRPEALAEIRVTSFHAATRLAVTRPDSSDAAQYSLPVSVAIAALNGTVLPEHVQPDYFNRPDVMAVTDSIRLIDDAAYTAEFPGARRAHVEVVLRDGRVVRSGPYSARGNHDNPLSDQELVEKFSAYTAGLLGEVDRQRLACIVTEPDAAPGYGEICSIMSRVS